MNSSKKRGNKREIGLNEGITFLLHDTESKTDSEQRDTVLQAQINRLDKKFSNEIKQIRRNCERCNQKNG